MTELQAWLNTAVTQSLTDAHRNAQERGGTLGKLLNTEVEYTSDGGIVIHYEWEVRRGA